MGVVSRVKERPSVERARPILDVPMCVPTVSSAR